MTLRCILFLAGLLPALVTLGQNAPLPLTSYWTSPQFLGMVTGSYGINSAIEPTITSEEKQLFEQLVPLIRSNKTEAKQFLTSAIAPDSSAALDFTLGNLRFETGDYLGAARSYQAAIDKFPGFQRAWKLAGVAHARVQDYVQSARYLLKAIELGAADGDTYGLLAFSYLNQEKYASAATAYSQALIFSPDSYDWKTGKAQCLNAQNRWDEAIVLLDELLRERPREKQLWLFQANAYLSLNRIADAAANYEMVRRMGMADENTLYQLGDIYVNQGVYDLAETAYREALQKAPPAPVARPPSPRAVRAVGNLVRWGAWAQAESLRDEIRSSSGESLEPDDDLALLNLEARIATARGNDERAMVLLRQITSRDPLNGPALLQLAQAFAQRGEYEEAAFRFEAAARLPDHEADAFVEHARMLVETGDFSRAAKLLRRAQSVRPRENVARYLEAVERAALAAQPD